MDVHGASSLDGVRWLLPIGASSQRLIDSVSVLTDDQVRATSLVPPWTRGHVLTHVCRAGDSLIRLLSWARTEVEIAQYPSMDFRAAEIEAGCRRTVSEIVGDLQSNVASFDREVRSLPAAAWSFPVVPRTGEPRTPATLVPIRLRELEIHHVDLDVGYTFADIPALDAHWILGDLLDAMERAGVDFTPVRLTAVDSDFTRVLGGGESDEIPMLEVSGPLAELLGWLSGRVSATDTALVARGRRNTIPPAPRWI